MATDSTEWRQAAVFRGLSGDQLGQLAAIGTEREYEAGAVLFRVGDAAREMLVVVAGNVQLEFPVSVLGEVQGISFETKGSGEVLGWSALVEPRRFTLGARTAGPVRVFAFPGDQLGELLDQNPELGHRFLRNLIGLVRLRLDRTQALWSHEIQRSLDSRYR